ncbi:MAG: aminotransferase class IV [Dehalococcoidia bacterium]|nr:aminotransferase class IV [Dehalococcoidia bacterium]
MEAVVYLNGALVPLSQARISPMDYGFLYGYGLFETMRAYKGYVFRVEKHLARLERAARALNIDLDSLATLEKAIYDTLEANHLSNASSARIRLSVSPGQEDLASGSPAKGGPTVFITAKSYTPPSPDVYRRGFVAMVSRVHRSPRSPASALKSLSALDILLARQEAASYGVDHAILLNEDDLVAEGSSSNVFYVNDRTLFTPAEHSGILRGVTRDVVLNELAPSLELGTKEVDVALSDLLEAEEAFLTNSMIEIMPLTIVADRRIGTGRPGPVTRRLMKAYQELVEQSLIRREGTDTP